jgi:hypothetical protein
MNQVEQNVLKKLEEIQIILEQIPQVSLYLLIQ